LISEKYDIIGLVSAAGADALEQALSRLSGVESARVNLVTSSLTIRYDPALANGKIVREAVTGAGFEAIPRSARPRKKRPQTHPNENALMPNVEPSGNILYRLIVSVGCTVPLAYFSIGYNRDWALPDIFVGHENALIAALTQLILAIPVLMANRGYLHDGMKALARGKPSLDSLIALAVTAAMLYGLYGIYGLAWEAGHPVPGGVRIPRDLYFETAVIALTIVTIGKTIESKARDRYSDAVHRLRKIRPEMAIVKRNGGRETVEVEDIVPGDELELSPGQVAPVDGIVISGHAKIDASALTGECYPTTKGVGARVWGGSINLDGYITIRADQSGDESAISRLIRLVEEAASSRANISRHVDRIGAVFAPLILLAAVATGVVWLLLSHSLPLALARAISVVMVSSPCALTLATPMSVLIATVRAAQFGIAVKSAETLENAHDIDTVVLDKTGTVTAGKPTVTDIISLSDLDHNDLLRIAASIQRQSELPLAAAIVEEAKRSALEPYETESFTPRPGKGVEAVIKGKRYFAGGPRLLQENGIDISELVQSIGSLAAEGKTPFSFGCDGKALGIVAVADVMKPGSRAAIAALKRMNLDVIMLTADNALSAAALQQMTGVSRVIAEMLPEGRSRVIAELKDEGRRIAMIGDGINDTPALLAADVGIAIGSGTEIVSESAGISLMRGDLRDAVTALALGKAVIRNIRQNVALATFASIVGLPIAIGILPSPFTLGFSPAVVTGAMGISTTLVALNSWRLAFFRRKTLR